MLLILNALFSLVVLFEWLGRLILQAHNGTVLTHQVRKTARLSQASVISHASYISKTGRRNSDTSSVHSKFAIKSFFKDMLHKLCPERPRYFNRPLDDKHGDSDQVCLTSLNVDLYHAVIILHKTKQFARLAYRLGNHKNDDLEVIRRSFSFYPPWI